MFCPNCGSENPDSNKFCISCGSSLSHQSQPLPGHPMKIQLRCKACGGTLEAPNDRNILSCPFCGAKEMMTENDNVTIQRLKSNTAKDLVFGVMDRVQESKRQKVEEQRRKEEEQKEQTRKMLPWFLVAVAMTLLFVFCMAFCERGEMVSHPTAESQTEAQNGMVL